MDKREIIERLNNIAKHAAHTVGEEPFVMSLDDGIAVHEAVELLKKPETNCSEIPNNSDTISRQAAIDKFIDGLEEIFSDIREREVDDSVCGLCEYDGAYIGQSGDWCNECPGFDRDDCFKLSDKIRKEWTDEIIKALPSIQPERKTGHWILDRSGAYCCSKCMEPCAGYVMMKPRDKFCKMCGAKMEDERKE